MHFSSEYCFFLDVTNSWYQMNVPLYIYQSRTWRNVVCLVFLINSKWDIISPSSCQEIVRHLLDVCILIFQGSVNDYSVIFLVLQANAIVFIFPESFDCIYALEKTLTQPYWQPIFGCQMAQTAQILFSVVNWPTPTLLIDRCHI